LPPDAIQNADPAVLRAWATNANVPAERRLAAAERAAALGALPLDELRLLYSQAGALLKTIKSGDSPRDRAQLYFMANQDATPAVRAEALQSLLQAGLKRGEFAVTARLVGPLLLEVAPGRDLDWFAPLAARALFVTDQPDKAELWASVADARAQDE